MSLCALPSTRQAGSHQTCKTGFTVGTALCHWHPALGCLALQPDRLAPMLQELLATLTHFGFVISWVGRWRWKNYKQEWGMGSELLSSPESMQHSREPEHARCCPSYWHWKQSHRWTGRDGKQHSRKVGKNKTVPYSPYFCVLVAVCPKNSSSISWLLGYPRQLFELTSQL